MQQALDVALAPFHPSGPLGIAARTDAGVHALAQVVSVSLRSDVAPDALRRAVNSATPDGLLCLDAWRASPSFHARASARTRTYVYLVGAPPPAALAGFAWALPDPRAFPGVDARLDAAAMRAALLHAVGTHDFRSFARPGAQRGTVRTVLRADVTSAAWAPLHAIAIEGHGFLRAMVRNLVGTAVSAGLGLVPPGHVRDLLTAGGRYRGVRAPGWGLTLAAVSYPFLPP